MHLSANEDEEKLLKKYYNGWRKHERQTRHFTHTHTHDAHSHNRTFPLAPNKMLIHERNIEKRLKMIQTWTYIAIIIIVLSQ